MDKFTTVIFSDTYKGNDFQLVNGRTLASIPFGGRFRAIDFVLSSVVNAGCSNVAVVTKRNFSSLQDHLCDGKYWDLDHRNSGLKLLSPFFKSDNNNEVFMARGKLDALRSIMPYIEEIKTEYVLLTNANVISNIDFEDVCQKHTESGADITVPYTVSDIRYEKEPSLEVDKNGKLTGVGYTDENGNIKRCIGAFLLSKSLLTEIIKIAEERDIFNIEKYLFNSTDKYNIYGYEQKEYCGIINNIEDYFKISMDMLDCSKRSQVFNTQRPVMTRVMDSVPTLYRYNAKVENSLIADGCKIDGTVKNCIISRNVEIEEGAVVENSVIMQNTIIKAGSTISYSVLDKNVYVSENKFIKGVPECPFVLHRDSKI